MVLIEARRRTLSDAYRKATERLREWLGRRLDNDSLDIARLYRADRDRLLFRIRTVYETYLKDDPTYVRARATGANLAIDQAIDSHVKNLARELNSNAVENLTGTLNMQPQAVRQHLAPYSGMSFKELPWPGRNVLNELTTGVTAGGTFFDHMFHITDGLKDKVTGDVRSALLRGETFEELRDRMMKTFGVDKLAEPKGPAYSSVKIYKNEARKQWNLLMSRQARSQDAVEVWYAIIDDNSTPGCVARHGRILGDDDDLPPRHINCRCTIAVFERNDDLSSLRVEADAWLQSEGYTRRQAAQMEAETGFPWGSFRLRPLMTIETSTKSEPNGFAYRPVERLDVPAFAVGVVPDGDWYSTEAFAQATGSPDAILVRTDDLDHASEKSTAWTTEGWRSLRKVENARWIEMHRGYVADSPEIGPTWEPHRRRLTLDLIERWPALRTVTFPDRRLGQVYAVRIMDITEARSASLGIFEPREWLSSVDLSETVKLLLKEGFLPGVADPHLAVAIVPTARQQQSSDVTLAVPVVTVAPEDVTEIVSMASGTVIYAKDAFDGGLLAPYYRVAIVCFEPNHQIWAIRPRGMPFWALPGGHVDEGESPQDAAQREMEEETGVPVTVIASLGKIYRPWSTTEVFLARRDGPAGAPLRYDEIDAAFPIHIENLEDTDKAWLTKKWDLIRASRTLVEGVGKFRRRFPPILEAFDPALHPRGAAGTHMGGKFVPKGKGGGEPADVKQAIRQKGEAPRVTIRNVSRVPVYVGKAIAIRTKFGSKKESGEIGEHIVAAFLQQKDPTAHLVKPESYAGNYPIDGVARGEAFDIKTGLISAGKDKPENRQWRTTFDTKPEEQIRMAGMARDRVSKYNESKMKEALQRKDQACQTVANLLGKTIRSATYGVILNPDTSRADIYRFGGFHRRIEWADPHKISGNYLGTVSFLYKSPKKEADILWFPVPLVEAEKTPTLDDLSPDARAFWAGEGLLHDLPLPLLVWWEEELGRLYLGWIKVLMDEFGDASHAH
jgi:SPP1 gp7 family putative phage head morphogenesis protein